MKKLAVCTAIVGGVAGTVMYLNKYGLPILGNLTMNIPVKLPYDFWDLFTKGIEKFDRAYEKGIISGVLTTNLIYQMPELLEREWYISCDMSKYIAYIIDTLNHDSSISDLLNPIGRIQSFVDRYKKGEINEE